MAKFVYRMQNILDLKIKMEEQRKAEYGLANARLRKEEDKLRELIIRKAGYEKQARELVQGTIDVHKIHTCKHAIDAMKSAIRTQMSTCGGKECRTCKKQAQSGNDREKDL